MGLNFQTYRLNAEREIKQDTEWTRGGNKSIFIEAALRHFQRQTAHWGPSAHWADAFTANNSLVCPGLKASLNKGPPVYYAPKGECCKLNQTNYKILLFFFSKILSRPSPPQILLKALLRKSLRACLGIKIKVGKQCLWYLQALPEIPACQHNSYVVHNHVF